MKYQKYLWFLFILVISSKLHCQNEVYGYEKIGTEIEKIEKGLSQNSVRTIFQDSKGFIWIGTWSGLNRFDGMQFKVFLPDVKNPEHTLSNQVINALVEDSNGNIWIGTEGGLNRLNLNSLEIKQYKNISNSHYANSNDTIRSLFYEKDRLWIGTQQGLFLGEDISDTTIEVKTIAPNNLLGKDIRSIKALGKNSLLLGTDNGLFILDKERLEIESYFTTPLLSSELILSLLKYNDSLLLIGTEHGLNLLNINTSDNRAFYASNKKDSLSNDIIMALMKDADSNVWVATSGGGILSMKNLNEDNIVFKRIQALGLQAEQSPTEFLEEIYFYSMLQSRDGTIWLGSAWSGIYKLLKERNIFKKFQKSNITKGLNDNHIWAFYDDGDDFWIGTEKGINIYNKKTHTTRYLTAQGKKGDRLISNKIRSIFKDSQGNFWIGSYKGGLSKYFPADGHVEWFTPNSDSAHFIANTTVWKIVEDNQKNLWIATHNGLQKTNLINGKTKVYQNNPMDSSSISSNVIYNLYFDKTGVLWIATFNGLNKYNKKYDNFKVYKHIKHNLNSLNINRIFSVYEDDSMNIWVGTIGGGLNQINQRTGEISSFTTHEGLPDNTIYSIIGDDFGNLWMSTNYGISALNIKNKSFVNYNVNDGLTSNEFNFGASLKDKYGNIYFGSMFGFNVLKPKDIQATQNIPEIVVSEFTAEEGPSYYCLHSGDEIHLKHTQNSLFFRFSMLDYTNPRKDAFKYKIVGIDNDWKNLSADYPIVTISKMLPGTYHLLIEGSNSSGIWTTKTTDIKIVMDEAWYNLLIFKILFVLIISFFVFLIIRNRVKRIRFRHQAEKQLLELERQTLRLQMNPHFIFNTLNSIQNYILKNDVDKSIGYLSKFSKLMRMMLAFSKEQAISLEDEIFMLSAYLDLENLRHQHGFDFSINVDGNVDPEFVTIPPMLIQPFVENAVIHGLLPLTERKGFLEINISMDNDFVLATIKDNGVGRKHASSQREHGHKPSGMLITQKRLELINKTPENQSNIKVIDLVDENGSPLGTQFEIKIKQIDIEKSVNL